MKLTLYTTLGCHLCDKALEIIHEVRTDSIQDLDLQCVEIADSDLLMERYGIRIPVVQLESARTDLGWPFDKAQLLQYLRH